MNTSLEIAKRETGILRVFQISDDVMLRYSLKGDCEGLERALGGTALNPQEMQSVGAGELTDLEFEKLLIEGYDVAPDAIDVSAFSLTTSPIILIRSAAFETKPATLKLTQNAKLVATFTEGKSPAPKFTPLESDAAKGVLSGSAPDTKPRRSFGTRLAWTALAALVASFAWVYIYYIGF